MVTEMLSEKKITVDMAIENVTNKKQCDNAVALNTEVKAAIADLDTQTGGTAAAVPLVVNCSRKKEVTHAILVGPGPGVRSDENLARCGWRFGAAQHKFPQVTEKPHKKCNKCFRNQHCDPDDASEASDSSVASLSD